MTETPDNQPDATQEGSESAEREEPTAREGPAAREGPTRSCSTSRQTGTWRPSQSTPRSGPTEVATSEAPGVPRTAPAGPLDPSPPLPLDARGPVPVAIWASALRCVVSYVLVPLAAPVVGFATVVALPIVVALHAVGIGASGRGVVRGVRTDRWGTATLACALLSLNLLSLLAQVGSALP